MKLTGLKMNKREIHRKNINDVNSSDNDLLWIAKENLKKSCLLKRFLNEVESLAKQLK